MEMPVEALWLAWTLLLTALMPVVYVLNRIGVRGVAGAMANPSPDLAPPAPWAERAQRAHVNTVENLVLFAPAIAIIVALPGLQGPGTAMAAMTFFLARLVYFIVYTLGIPVARTLAWTVGWLATLYLILVCTTLVI